MTLSTGCQGRRPPPAQPGPLFGSGSFALPAHPGPINQSPNKKVPVIYTVPFQSPRATARGEGASIAAVGQPQRTEGQTDHPPAPTTLPLGRQAAQPSPPASPPHAGSAAQSRRPDGRAHARWLGRQRLQRSPRAQVAQHGTAPLPCPQPAQPGRTVRVQKALLARGVPGATSPSGESGLLGSQGLLPGDAVAGKGTTVLRGSAQPRVMDTALPEHPGSASSALQVPAHTPPAPSTATRSL